MILMLGAILLRTTGKTYRPSNQLKRTAAVQPQVSEAPCGACMTTLAGCEIVAAERALALMTSHATLAAPGGVMIERLGLRDLPALRHGGANLMTRVT